jgi:hypothetical protein
VQNPPQNSSQTVSGLTLFATEEFRSSGLEATIVPDFEKEMKCKINIRLFSDPALMMRAFVEAGDSVDIVSVSRMDLHPIRFSHTFAPINLLLWQI